LLQILIQFKKALDSVTKDILHVFSLHI